MQSSSRQACCATASGKEMHFLGAHIKASLAGQLLQVQLQQRFRNPGQRSAEITYTCPLPWGAVLLGIDVTLGGKALQGKVVGKVKARETYENALAAGDASILVSSNPDGSISMELGNLLPEEDCAITLRYAQVLQMEQNHLRCALPMTIAPRYGDAVRDGGFEPHSAPQASLQVQYPFTFELRVQGELAQAAISSPSHVLQMRQNQGDVLLTLGSNTWLDRDLIILLEDLTASSVASSSADALKPQETVVLACMVPRLAQGQQDMFAQQLATAASGGTVRGIKAQILVDCSGSMHGESMSSARQALTQIISQLQARDHFSLSKFGSTCQHRFRHLRRANEDGKTFAQLWLNDLHADMGGTEMEAAILSTLELAQNPGSKLEQEQASDLLLITDGEIHNVESLVQLVKERGHRIFTVGIGASPAQGLLQRLAAVSGGSCEWVAPGQAVEPMILRMFKRLRGQRLQGVQLQAPEGVKVLSSHNLPSECFTGDQIAAYLRISGPWPEGGVLQLTADIEDETGHISSGQGVAECVVQTLPTGENSLARMAAHADCMERLQASADPAARTRKAVAKLAVDYQIVTTESHFVLVHERAEADKSPDIPELIRTPNMLASGWAGASSSNQPRRANIQVFSSASPSETNHNSYYVPSVWHTKRTPASELVMAIASGGMDDVEIPAFLRKQPDDAAQVLGCLPPEIEPLPVLPSEAIGADPSNFVGLAKAHLNTEPLLTLQALRELFVPEIVIRWLADICAQGHAEEQVVAHFVDCLLQLRAGRWKSKAPVADPADTLAIAMADLWLATAKQWPRQLMGTAVS